MFNDNRLAIDLGNDLRNLNKTEMIYKTQLQLPQGMLT